MLEPFINLLAEKGGLKASESFRGFRLFEKVRFSGKDAVVLGIFAIFAG